MTELRQRIEPFRSRKYLDGSRGATCKLRFPGICIGGTETTVACHVHNDAFGMARKADDWSVIDGCFECHSAYDQHRTGLTDAELLWHLLRGLQETIEARLQLGLIVISQDTAKAFHDTPVRPRKPKAARKPIYGNPKIPTRPMRSVYEPRVRDVNEDQP
jgi:hypothetical protein